MINFSNFIDTERMRYADKDNNLFAFSLMQASRYYDFILIVAYRHNEVSQRFVLATNAFMESMSKAGDGTMTEGQIRLWAQSQELNTLVQLEIESFYLFAKILLDKVAFFLFSYFGQAKGISLVSHHKLTESYKQYEMAKQLVYPTGFSESLRFLQEHVCEYRDKQISHLQKPRAIKGTILNPSGQTRMSASTIYPTPNEIAELARSQAVSKELPELMAAVDAYLKLVLAVIELNRSKTKFRLNPETG